MQPNFSVSNYFIIMFCLLIIATIAFSLLNFLPLSIRARKQNSISNNSNVKNKVQPATSVTDKSIEYDKSTNIFDPSTANSNTELINANEDQTQNRELTVSEKRKSSLDDLRTWIIFYLLWCYTRFTIIFHFTIWYAVFSYINIFLTQLLNLKI